MTAPARKPSAKPAKPLPLVVAEWRRNAAEDIVVTLGEFNGQNTIDVRTWFKDGNERRPTRTGITLSVKHLPALAAALVKALREAERLKLMKAVEAVR